MGTIDEQLRELKDSYQIINSPPALESELRSALSRSSPNHKKTGWIAAAVITFLLFGYSWDALAYYSKKVVGYEKVVTESVKGLMLTGQGQQIDKSARFTDGVVVTLDELIMDGQGITTMVKCKYPEGFLKTPEDTVRLELKGIFRYINGGASGQIKGNTVYWVCSFDDEPMILEKKMELLAERRVGGRLETVAIPFILKRSQAYVPTAAIKIINEQINTVYGTVYFDSVQASALSTVVSGRIKNAGQLASKQAQKNVRLKFSLMNGDTRLGEEASSLNSADDKDFKFSYKFAGLRAAKALKITDISFEEYWPGSKKIMLEPGMKPAEIGVRTGMAVLEQVSVKNGSTVVAIRMPRNNTADMGFFRGDKQLEVTVKREQDGSFNRSEYVIPGQGITMEVKGITINYPIERTIIIK
ncbi:MAG: DUF4179 domain-containing protein [Methylocystaceae bacterium]